MQNEKDVLLAELREKMEREMKQYEEKLIAMPPERILEEAYHYTIYREISCLMEESDLNARQLRALLKSENPMAEIYARWLDTEISFSEEVRSVIRMEATAIIHAEMLLHRKRDERDAR
ncbi:MAG: DUF3848 domain-containing protein [Clostridia bacterium]|nr:DUF3848 domain-containing protein [Clostridia bacterium]